MDVPRADPRPDQGLQQGLHSVGFRRIEIVKSHTLGIGSYGSVYKAKCDQLSCAAKILHPTLFDRDAERLVDPDRAHRLPIKRFEQECEFLSSMRHPNIIQYLGICLDPSTNLPVLLMELMDGSLTQFLAKSQTTPLPFHTQVNICHDISLALSFLHSNGIIHRDLSSNNVLMIGDRRAKVTDFGMAKTFRLFPKTVTKVPGTEVYMPPEALQDQPTNYNDKLDCFSFGVVVIQVLTRRYPKPGALMKKLTTRNGEEFYQKNSELDRRSNHINLIAPPNHPLLTVALECIGNSERERPPSALISERLGEQVSSPLYAESQSSRNGGSYLAQLEHLLKLKDEHIQTLSSQFQRRIESLEVELRAQLQAHETNTATDITMVFQQGNRAPRAVYRMSNAVVHGDMVYFVHLNSRSRVLFYSYNSVSLEWSQLPDIDADRDWNIRTIVIAVGCLTTVGGYDEDENLTNQLFSLIGDEGGTAMKKWEEFLPPMPTKRDCSIAFSYSHFLVVAGGTDEDDCYLRTVEVLDTDSMTWFTSVSLPEPLSNASVTLCGENIFILGGWFSSNTPTCSVLMCKVNDLLRPQPRPDDSYHHRGMQVWNRIVDLPVLKSTCIAYRDHLLAVGGVNVMNKPVNAVYKYDWAYNSWRVIGQMLLPRGQAFATVLPSGKLLVVGGHKGYYLNKMYEVEIATIHSSLK